MNKLSEKDDLGLKKEKQKGKNKIKVLVIMGLCIVLAAGGGFYYYKMQVQNEATEEEIVLEENQQLVYAKITSISGNEMTYALAEAQTIQMNMPSGDTSGASENSSGRSGRGNMDMSAYDTVSTDDDGNMTGFTILEETQTLMIPVGTEVVTKLGNVTTFSRLANGDIIKMIIQTDADGTQTIMKVYMIA